MAFPSFAWKYVPSSGVPNPPRCLSPGLSGAGLWGALGCAPLAEVGECGACSGRACGVFRARVPGVCLQMGPEGSHRRASGVSSERQRSLICPLAFPSGYHRLSLWRARVRLRAVRLLSSDLARGAVNGVLFIAGVVCIEPPPSNGARLPAELKHITKRRKRNQQGCP